MFFKKARSCANKQHGEDSPSKNLITQIAAEVHSPNDHRLHPPDEIKAILHRECARCERSGSEFCMVVIDPGQSKLAKQQLSELLLIISRRSDEVGLLNDIQLCVFLTYTPPQGAEQFLARFKQRAFDLGWKPAVELFVYPSDMPTDPPDDKPGDDIMDSRAMALKINAKKTASEKGTESPTSLRHLLARPSPLWKRITDVVLSGSAFLLLLPLMLGIAAIVKLTSKGPIFYSQWRIGLGGRQFRIYKYRTMIPNAENLKDQLRHMNERTGPAFKMACDPRITRIGRLLRKTSMDELPQLWNILIGDMSLVGPRPLEADETAACHPWQRRRLDVVPGLTCTWQISDRNRITFTEWARMDRKYIRRQSFIYDAKLMALTVPAVLSRRGAI